MQPHPFLPPRGRRERSPALLQGPPRQDAGGVLGGAALTSPPLAVRPSLGLWEGAGGHGQSVSPRDTHGEKPHETTQMTPLGTEPAPPVLHRHGKQTAHVRPACS